MTRPKYTRYSVPRFVVIALAITILGFGAWIWVAQLPGRANERGSQLSNIQTGVRDGRFIGLSREAITEILGPPIETAHFREWDMHYVLGPDGSYFSIDHSWLVLKFEDGVVVEAKVLVD